MVKIRLRRVGAKKQPYYRVVVADTKSPRDGRFLETIGHYNPRTDPPSVEIDAERAIYWLGVGAQPSEAVRQMLDRLGILARAAAIKRGEVAAAPEAEPVQEELDLVAKGAGKAKRAAPSEKDLAAAEAALIGAMAGAAFGDEEEAGALAEVEPSEAEEIEEEEDEFEEDLYDEEEDFDELDEWEPEVAIPEESEDYEDDWELDIEEDEDVDDDQAYEEDDE
jgi:small subunit ribosomal protein S16